MKYEEDFPVFDFKGDQKKEGKREKTKKYHV